jgi:hypothetical protein
VIVVDFPEPGAPRSDEAFCHSGAGDPFDARGVLVSEFAPSTFDEFRRRLDAFLGTFGHPPERRRAYGNLRHEYSEWDTDAEHTTNVAVIYETPGGSTTQVGVTYDHRTGDYSYLNGDLSEPIVTRNPDQPLHMIADEVRSIPDRRLQRLRRQIEGWYGEGKCQREMFAEMNKLLQSNFLGGSITQRELKLGIMHAIDLRRSGEA